MVTITISLNEQILDRCALHALICVAMQLHASHCMSNFLASYNSILIPRLFEIGLFTTVDFSIQWFLRSLKMMYQNGRPNTICRPGCAIGNTRVGVTTYKVLSIVYFQTWVCIITYTLRRTLTYYHNSFTRSLKVSM
jgi:hypothetical protein